MAVVMLVWCGLTLWVHGPVNRVPLAPDLRPKVEYQVVDGDDRVTGEKREMWQRDPATGRLVPKIEPTPRASWSPCRSSTKPPARQEDPLGLLGPLPRLGPAAAPAGQLVEPDRRDRHPAWPSATRSWP